MGVDLRAIVREEGALGRGSVVRERERQHQERVGTTSRPVDGVAERREAPLEQRVHPGAGEIDRGGSKVPAALDIALEVGGIEEHRSAAQRVLADLAGLKQAPAVVGRVRAGPEPIPLWWNL